MPITWPRNKPKTSGLLPAEEDSPHRVAWEVRGNPKGEPVLFIHGGPGQRSPSNYFDDNRYRVILWDQPGYGDSTPNIADDPAKALEGNDLNLIFRQINRLRRELNIRGKMHIFGGSWGSTVALAYAILYPHVVQTLILRGVFLARRKDVDYLFQGNAANYSRDPFDRTLAGAYQFFPTAWRDFAEAVPDTMRGDMVKTFWEAFTHSLHDKKQLPMALHLAAALKRWEASVGSLNWDEEDTPIPNPERALASSRLLMHFLMNGAFLGGRGEANRDNNYIIENAARLSRIPIYVVHGRYDNVCPLYQAEELVAALRRARNKAIDYTITTAGHGGSEPETKRRLIEIMKDMPLMTAADLGLPWPSRMAKETMRILANVSRPATPS